MANVARRSVVKICGLSTFEHARVAATHGADLLGFIFAPSRRRVAAATVRGIHDAFAREAGDRPPFVGVFVNPSPEEVAEMVASAHLDLVQLSGDEATVLADEIPVPYIRAIRMGREADLDGVLRDADRWMSLRHRPHYLLVDAAVPGSYGGSGQRANWQIARELASRFPTLLAGGLDPENVAEGLAATGARGADVSSGVETNGVKNADLIARFIAAARDEAM